MVVGHVARPLERRWDNPSGQGLEAVALAMLRLENDEHLRRVGVGRIGCWANGKVKVR